jgi:predicted RNase H-like nuclease (RuvC/YqgF family)
MSSNIENKVVRFEAEYSKLLQEMKRSEAMIKNLENEVADKSRGMIMSKKEMKISTTIEDLRQTLDKQIEEKDKVIKVYEHLIDGIRTKLNEKITN